MSKNLFDMCGISLEDLVELYCQEKSVVRVARKLGASRPTISKWLRIAGVETLGHRPKSEPSLSMKSEFGPIARWIKDNPEKKLPRSNRKAAEVIGVSEHAVCMYMYNRRNKIMRYIESFGDLRSFRIVLKSKAGKNVNTAFIDDYAYKFNPKTYIVSISVQVKTLHLYCEYTLKEFLTILRTSDKV